MYGDRMQSLYLLNCFNRDLMNNQNKCIKEYKQTITAYVRDVLEGEDYNYLLEVCNSVFVSAINNVILILLCLVILSLVEMKLIF